MKFVSKKRQSIFLEMRVIEQSDSRISPPEPIEESFPQPHGGIWIVGEEGLRVSIEEKEGEGRRDGS